MTLIEFGRKEQIGNSKVLNDIWSSIAQDLGVSVPLVKLWAYNQRRVPADHVINLEIATNGEVPRHHTRPDIYPTDDIQELIRKKERADEILMKKLERLSIEGQRRSHEKQT